MPPALLLICLLALPLLEIAAFVVVGSEIGALATVALTLATSLAGAVLLRVQGSGALRRIRDSLHEGRPPAGALVHAAMIFIAGVLLIAPGFVTDTLGLLLFIPFVRTFAWSLAGARVVVAGTPGAPNPYGRTIDLESRDYSREPHEDDERRP